VQLHRDRVGEGLEAAALAGQLIRRLCQGLTLGPYLRPSLAHIPVYRYWTPEEFEGLGAIARELGFADTRSGPLVRSRYHAGG
jgi:lipoic acid synthetase